MPKTREDIKAHLLAGGKVLFNHQTFTQYEYCCPHDGYEIAKEMMDD